MELFLTYGSKQREERQRVTTKENVASRCTRRMRSRVRHADITEHPCNIGVADLGLLGLGFRLHRRLEGDITQGQDAPETPLFEEGRPGATREGHRALQRPL